MEENRHQRVKSSQRKVVLPWPWVVAGIVALLLALYGVFGLTLSLHIPDSRAVTVPVRKEPGIRPSPKKVESPRSASEEP